MKKRKRRKRLLSIIFIIVVLIVCFYVGKKIYIKLNTFNVKVVDKINNYSYTLDDRDTELFKNNYNELKNVLNNSEIDYETYAKLLAKLFIIDLYTLNNKVNKYDIGGVEFVYPDAVDNYKLKVQDTLYKYIEDNTNKKRNQELPIVKEINTDSTNTDKYKIGDKEYEAYKVSLTWSYEKELEYDKKGTIILIKQDKTLFVAEYTNK